LECFLRLQCECEVSRSAIIVLLGEVSATRLGEVRVRLQQINIDKSLKYLSPQQVPRGYRANCHYGIQDILSSSCGSRKTFTRGLHIFNADSTGT